MNNNFIYSMVVFLTGGLLLASCGEKTVDSATGWVMNDQDWGGYERTEFEGQDPGPNLVLIPGGTFTMGQVEEDVMYSWNNVPHQVTVTSFYMDETEVTNANYRFYTKWTKRTFGTNYPLVWRETLPDTLVWREELSYNEPLVHNYFRHPAYNNYPVVGVTWVQAKKYCKWRTDRANEAILIKKGILNPNPDQQDSDNFTTGAYLAGQYQGDVRKNIEDKRTGGERSVRIEDGILLPDYRLPTEAQWEYAALALIGNMENPENELITDRRIYPWNGSTVRYQRRDKHQGDMLANFKRGSGDYMGIAGNLNDNAAYTAPVGTFYPNDFGLYNMAGNVSEWTADVYRPLTGETLRDVEENDANAFRGNVFKTLVRDENGNLVEKDSLGRLKKRRITKEEASKRSNYDEANAKDYLDGEQDYVEYLYGKTTLINDSARVIKGGSWADRAYWLAPGTRRFFQQDRASKTIGFRCAMTKVGGATQAESAGKRFKGNKNATMRRFK